MIAWMLYAALVAVLIAAGALALERLMASAGRPRRFAWMAALTLAVLVPLPGGRREPPPPVHLPVVVAGESAAPEPVTVHGGRSLLPPLPIPASRTASRTAALTWGATSAASLFALCAVLLAVACATRRWPRRRVDGTKVYLSRRFGPALVGIVSPRPVIPSWVLESEPDTRAAILRHEQEHARARDHLALLYAGIVLAAFPWSPAIWWMCRRLRAAIEMDCDQRVIASGIGAAEYGAVLLRSGSRSRTRWGFAPAMGQPTSTLERRLRTMSEKKKKLNGAHGALLAVATLVALGVACDLPAPAELGVALDEVLADDSQPLVFLDAVRVEGLAEVTTGRSVQLASSGPIAAIHVVKGLEATATYGEEATNGVVNVYTGDPQAAQEHTMTVWGAPRDGSGPGSPFTESVELTTARFSFTGMPESLTTNPGEHLRIEPARSLDWPEEAQPAPDGGESGQGHRVLGLVSGLLESEEVVQGALLFTKNGELRSRVRVMKDSEE